VHKIIKQPAPNRASSRPAVKITIDSSLVSDTNTESVLPDVSVTESVLPDLPGPLLPNNFVTKTEPPDDSHSDSTSE
jgi:hypothetical protein